jgi:hypothetical protein
MYGNPHLVERILGVFERYKMNRRRTPSIDIAEGVSAGREACDDGSAFFRKAEASFNPEDCANYCTNCPSNT